MKAKITKLVSLCTMTAMFLFSSVTTQEIKAANQNDENSCSIESCADTVREIYKDKYPESADMIDDIVDSIIADEQFIYIFEEEGEPAFEIVEDSLNDALDPEQMPMMTTDDLYTSKYSFPIVRQMNDYFCGPAATLMALIGSGASDYYYTNNTYILNTWQTYLSQSSQLNTTNKGTFIGKITEVLNKNIPSVNGCSYKSKIFIDEGYKQALTSISNCLINDAVPVINVSDTSLLGYYNGNSFGHYIVVNYVDFNAETVMLYDPHYDDRYYGNHLISFDEFNQLAKGLAYDDSRLWISVYTKN